MPNPFPDGVYWLFWGAAGLAVAWVCLPLLLALLGQTRVTITVVGGPETLQPTDDDPQYADLLERLRGLGFEPLCSRVESGWFFAQRWYKAGLPGRVLATPQRDCFASLYRLFPGDPWRLTFSTVFADGSMASTANQMTILRIEDADHLRWAYPSPDLAEVLRMHRQAAEGFRAAGGRTVAVPTAEHYLEVGRRHSERFLRKAGPRYAMSGLSNAVFFLGGPALALGLILDFSHWAVPLGVILGCVGYTAIWPYLLRSGSQKTRDQDQERGLEYQWAKRRQAARNRTRDSGQPPAPPSDGITAPRRPAWDDDRFTRNPPPSA